MDRDTYKILREKRDTILSIFDEAANVTGHFSYPETSKREQHGRENSYTGSLLNEVASLTVHKNHLQKGFFTIALLGGPTALKNLLACSLLGHKMLSNLPIPVPIVLIWGEQQTDIAVYETNQRSPRGMKWKQCIDELQQGTGVSSIEYIVIERRFPLLAAGIQLICFPTMAAIEKRKKTVETFLRRADLFILALDAQKPVYAGSLQLLEALQVTDNRRNVFFAVHAGNQAASGQLDVVKRSVEQMLRPYFLQGVGAFDSDAYNRRVFFIDMPAAFEAATTSKNSTEKLVASGLPALEESIVAYFNTSERMARKLEPTLKVLRSAASKTLAQIASEKKRIAESGQQGPQSLTETRLQRLQAAEKQLQGLVKRANITVYDQSKLALRERALHAAPPAAVSVRSEKEEAEVQVESDLAKAQAKVRAPRRREETRAQEGPDALKVWVDTDDHLEFALEIVRRSDISLSVRSEIQERVEQIRRRESDPHLYMAVVGEFSSGKSTFINALLRQELLPASVLPTTAASTEFRYGPELDVTIIFKSSGRPFTYSKESALIWQHIQSINSPDDIPIGELENCIQLVTANEQVAAQVSNVLIHHPASFLKDGIVIIDTPGVNALNEQHAKITYDLLEHEADGAVIMIPGPIPLSSSLADFITTQLKSFLHRCFFVITQMDRVRAREREKVRQAISQRLGAVRSMTQSVALYDCVAQAVLDVLEGSGADAEMLSWSEKFVELEDVFFDCLRRQRMLTIAESLLRLLNRLFEQLDESLRSRRQHYEARQAAIESDSIQDLQAFAREQHSTYQRLLTDSANGSRTKIERAINQQQATTREKIRQALFALSDADTLQTQLKEETSTLLESAGQAISRELQKVLVELETAAEQAGQTFDEEFTKEYRRLRAVSGLLVASQPKVDRRDIALDVEDILSPASQINQQLSNREGVAIGGGALGGAVVGTAIMPVVGTFIGLVAGGIIGAFFGPSLDKRKERIWEQLEPEIDKSFEAINKAARDKVDAYARELSVALDRRIDKYIARYKTTIDSMIRNQQNERKELNRLQAILEQDRKEVNRRRTILQRKQKELAKKLI